MLGASSECLPVLPQPVRGRFPRRVRGESAHPPGLALTLRSPPGVRAKLSVVSVRSFAVAGRLRFGGGGIGAPAARCHRGAAGQAREGLGRALGPGLLAGRPPGTSGTPGRAALCRCVLRAEDRPKAPAALG